ncbi:DUF2789 domain-containing protein [Shewanella sp. SR44-3]|uniref:DUF2789 domain-containing protein n=2 Tax=Shewanella TaxID=22 RepID=UPI0015FC7DFC|nr:DUF2789 domain-containing protein [Shewanella sp. SR44-3]MBB1270557.1 DUF2789 domain-containing protein [Shewanella sp. SR44-3]
MDTTQNDIKHLFQQLGLAFQPKDIEDFINNNKIPADIHLAEAAFWNSAQRHFLKESLNEDAQWSELIDQLDVLLRK